MSVRQLQYSEVERARIQQQIKALQEAVGAGGGGGPATWGSITGTLSAQTDLQTALNGKANSSHTHIIADVTGLQTALDGKQAAGSYAAASHTHIIGDVTGLQTALDGKQATLVSAVNIKTINGTSLLGSGNIAISGGGGGSPALSWVI